MFIERARRCYDRWITLSPAFGAVHDSDPTRREAVVFVHGNPGPMDDWEELAPPVEAFARARRGHAGIRSRRAPEALRLHH